MIPKSWSFSAGVSEVDGLVKDHTLRSADFAMCAVSIDYDDLERFCKIRREVITNKVGSIGSSMADFARSVGGGYVDVAAGIEGMELRDIDMPPRNQMVRGSAYAGEGIE